MPNSQWGSRLRDTDSQSAPLILSCAFSVLLLSIPRDYIVNGSMPPAYAVVNLITVLVFIVILYWAFRRKPDSQHTKYVMFLAAALLPMCAGCKKTRDAAGEWKSVEQYLEEHDGTQVTHGICPGCAKSMYGDFYKSHGAPGGA